MTTHDIATFLHHSRTKRYPSRDTPARPPICRQHERSSACEVGTSTREQGRAHRATYDRDDIDCKAFLTVIHGPCFGLIWGGEGGLTGDSEYNEGVTRSDNVLMRLDIIVRSRIACKVAECRRSV